MSLGRVSYGQLQRLRLLQPFTSPAGPPSSLSGLRTFATKSSTQEAQAEPGQTAEFFKQRFRKPNAGEAQAPTVRAPWPLVPTTPAYKSAGTQASSKWSPKPSRPKSPAPHSKSPVDDKQSTSLPGPLGSSQSADHDRREFSLSDNASTSAALPPSSVGTDNKGRPPHQAGSKRQLATEPVAATGSGAAAVVQGPKAYRPGTSPTHSTHSPNGSRRPGPPSGLHATKAPSATPAPDALGNDAACESSPSLTAERQSSDPSPQSSSINPNTASSGSPQATPVNAATNNAVHSTASLPTAAARVEPSMYAQKAVPFDVSASRRKGTTAIRDLLETQKITLQEYAPGQKPKVLCPRCHGGSQHEASLAVNISVDSQSAAWLCHRATCGWQGAIDQKTGTCSHDSCRHYVRHHLVLVCIDFFHSCSRFA